MSEKVFDVADVMERVQQDRELLEELLQIFEEDHIEKRVELEAAVAEKNFLQIKDIVHSMKGASGNISAKVIYATCSKVEELASQQNMDSIEACLPVLREQFLAFQGEARNLRDEWAAS